jgi:Glycosyl transferase family 2
MGTKRPQFNKILDHLAVGFDRIIVFTNDCDDGTDVILEAMSKFGPIEHYDNPPPYDAGSIQKQVLRRAYAMKHVKHAAWVLHIDADEYVNVTVGNRKIDDLIALHPDVDAIALMWRHFGSASQSVWTGGSVIESFPLCEGSLLDVEKGEVAAFKTLFRPQTFKCMSVHAPKLPRHRKVPVVVNAKGVEMPTDTMMSKRGSGYRVGYQMLTWDNALLHHHHVKSDDLHRLKHARGDANRRSNSKRLIGSEYYLQANRNEVRFDSLRQFRHKVLPWEQKLRSMPGVGEAEQAAWAWFQAHFQQDVAQQAA